MKLVYTDGSEVRPGDRVRSLTSGTEGIVRRPIKSRGVIEVIARGLCHDAQPSNVERIPEDADCFPEHEPGSCAPVFQSRMLPPQQALF